MLATRSAKTQRSQTDLIQSLPIPIQRVIDLFLLFINFFLSFIPSYLYPYLHPTLTNNRTTQPRIRRLKRAPNLLPAGADARADHAGGVGRRVRAAHQPDYLLGVLRRDAAVDDYFRRHWARAVEAVGVGSFR